jgi:hypothetical protein
MQKQQKQTILLTHYYTDFFWDESEERNIAE